MDLRHDDRLGELKRLKKWTKWMKKKRKLYKKEKVNQIIQEESSKNCHGWPYIVLSK